MSEINQKVGIIVGIDHHSFPNAVAKCVKAGISTIFHHVGEIEPKDLPMQWGYLDANKINETSLPYHGDLISFFQALPARYTVSDCCFAGIPISRDYNPAASSASCRTSIAGISFFQEYDHNQPGWLDKFRLDLGNTEALRVVVVPFSSPGVCRITGREIRGGFWSGFWLKTEQLPERTQGGRSKYEQTLVISPGDCRAHNFCVLDVIAGTVSWLMCE